MLSLYGSQPADEADVRLLLGQLSITFVQRAIFGVRHGVVRVALRRTYSDDARALHLALLHILGLIRHVLVFHDSSEGTSEEVVDHEGGLVEAVLGLFNKFLLEA